MKYKQIICKMLIIIKPQSECNKNTKLPNNDKRFVVTVKAPSHTHARTHRHTHTQYIITKTIILFVTIFEINKNLNTLTCIGVKLGIE